MEEFISKSATETQSFGREFAKNLKPGDVVSFFGDLGSGKTQMIKGICEFFSVKETVNSPTFIIQNEYFGFLSDKTVEIKHFDFFRIESEKEWDELGLDECLFNQENICLIEWAERIEKKLIQSYWKVAIRKTADNERRIEYGTIRY